MGGFSVPKFMKLVLALAFGMASVLVRSEAHAELPTCADLSRPNLVYVSGSTALKPFLGTLAQVLAKETPAYTIVYQGQGSCTGVASILSDDPAKRVIRDIPAVGGKAANYAAFFRADGTSQECSLDPAGNIVDVGASDVYAASCGFPAKAENVTDVPGPIQPMTFVVPAASSQRAISAEGRSRHSSRFEMRCPAPSRWSQPRLAFLATNGGAEMLATRRMC
jgi:hypothetical protein